MAYLLNSKMKGCPMGTPFAVVGASRTDQLADGAIMRCSHCVATRTTDD